MDEPNTLTTKTENTPLTMTGPVNIESGTNTIEKFDEMVAQSREQRNIKSGKYLFLSLLFPPPTLYLALFFAWRRRHLYIVLPFLTFIYSLLTFLTAVIGLFPAKVPAQYTQSAIAIDSTPVSLGVKILLFLTIVISVVGTVFGFAFWRSAKTKNTLEKKLLWFIFIVLNVEMVLVIYVIWWETMQLYSTVAPIVKSGYPGL